MCPDTDIAKKITCEDVWGPTVRDDRPMKGKAGRLFGSKPGPVNDSSGRGRFRCEFFSRRSRKFTQIYSFESAKISGICGSKTPHTSPYTGTTKLPFRKPSGSIWLCKITPFRGFSSKSIAAWSMGTAVVV